MQLIELKPILKNRNFKFLFINMFMVLFNYSAYTAFGGAFFSIIAQIKTLIFTISILVILKDNHLSSYRISNTKYMYFIMVISILSTIIGANSFGPLSKTLTFVIPFLYIIYCINYLTKYGAYRLLIALSLIIMICYAIIPIYYLAYGSAISSSHIYGLAEGEVFVSNHYGWASTIFILSSFTISKHLSIKKKYKIIILFFQIFSFLLLMNSACRSAILALSISLLYFIFKEKIVFYKKLILYIFLISASVYLSLNEDSAFQFILERTERQIEEKEEGRYETFIVMKDKINAEPSKWIYGVGMFDYTVLSKVETKLKQYHNSYLELLFGGGIIVFSLFILLMIIRPFKVFWRKTGQYSLLIFPLVIIPFFESDLTAGQFLFFPWFAYMILLNAKEFNA